MNQNLMEYCKKEIDDILKKKKKGLTRKVSFLGLILCFMLINQQKLNEEP